MASSHGMKLSLQDDFLFERPSTAIGRKPKPVVRKRPHTAIPTGNGTPWVNPNAVIPSNTLKKFNVSLNQKKSESRMSKKAPYAPRLKSGKSIWDEPKVVNGKVFTKPEYSSLEDPHLKTFFERKLGVKPNLTDSKPKRTKPSRNKEPRAIYSVSVITGDCKNAGTNANVFIQIRGTNGKLPRQKLEKRVEDGVSDETKQGAFTFQRGSSEVFMVRSPDIGKLIALEIEHDGVERNQSWFLESVLVKNQKTKEQWTLPCQKWLSLYENDCQVKRVLKPLSEEQKPERVIYEVEVVTGNVRGAGTDAHVFLSLYGDHGNTGRVQLVNRNVDTFERGQTDIFKIKVKHLGKLQRIMIDHDNQGFAPGWFLDRITITNLSNPKEKRYFICNKWLSKDDDDGEISRVLLGTSSLDNVISGHKYSISTFTGDVRGAGTDANVFITLFSKDGSSSEMKLNDSKNNFERKKIDIFHAECPILGALTRIRIRHDNKGLAPGWFLDKVMVKDGDNNSFEFPCGRWLSVSEDDGQISRDLVVGGSSDYQTPGIPYTIHITTGDIRGAGTDAKVYVILYGGKDGENASGKLWVRNGKKNNFSRARTDIFQVECAEQLSPIHHINIGHDNTGTAAGWYCEKVVIDSPTAGFSQTFFCRQWLADDEGDGLIERELLEDIDYRKQREIKNVWNVTAYTSDIFGAGTDANVSFTLYGEQGKSELISLANETNNFERASLDKFTVDIKDVGIPYKMIIGHDNSKPYSSWHLDKVLLENGQTNERYSFICGRWLGTDEDDGQCVRELPAAGGKGNPLPVISYKACVYTGDKYGAGTDSNVFLNIFGERGDTGDRPLLKSATNKNKFERKKIDEFIIESVSLKELKSIRIGHDGKGARDGWFLNKVIITDPTDNEDYQFICDRWLSSNEDDGHIVREIAAGDTSTLLKTTAYRISVKTGDIRGAGTNANVYIILFGDNKDSGKLPLRQAENAKNKWERGRTDMFTVEAMDIGKVHKLIIGHDGSGVGAGWFLASITLEVPSTGQHSVFACNRWLAVDEDDGLIERELYPSEEVEKSKKIPYEIEIHTGDCSGAGTNADVFIVLYGTEKKSEEFWLRSKSDNFERNKVDRFKVESDEVGLLTKLRVGHDNAGFNSAWFLDKILVRRLVPPNKRKAMAGDKSKNKKSGKRASHDYNSATNSEMDHNNEDDDECNYIFPCQRWLAKNEDDGQIIRDLVPYDKSGTKMRENALAATIYTVRVFTADVKNSGTNSNVFLTIYGDKGDTGERPLKKSDTHLDKFERNQEDIFKIDCISVGILSKLKVRHDNSGIKSSWFLDKIQIHDSSNEAEYIFPCNQWLSKTEDDGALSRELVAVDPEEYQRRRNRAISRLGSSTRQSSLGNVNLEQMANKTTYSIDVETGDISGAGTDANVYIILFGENGDSGKIDLKKSKTNKNKFERKQVDSFTAEAVDLGNLEKIRIGHDNKGGFAGWYLENVVINAPSLGHQWTFPAARWLDKGKEDGKLEIDLYPSAEKEEVYEIHVPYEIAVYTSDVQGGGTDSGVFIALYGMSNISTEQIYLTETKKERKECFNRGSVDIFVRELIDVGEQIDKIRIGHDNKGFRAGWHLDKVEVRRLTEGDRRNSAGSVTFAFPCGRWLSKGEDDGAIVRELVPSKVTEEAVIGGKVSISEHRVDALAIHTYKIHVFTGDVRRGGTDANVFITLFGANGDSGERQLSASETHRDKFERGQEDVFMLEAADLGYIRRIMIWHDDTNPNSDWYLDRVEVIDETENKCKYCFVCERWLAKKKGDGKLKRNIYERSYQGDHASAKSSVTSLYGSAPLNTSLSSLTSSLSQRRSSSLKRQASVRSSIADKIFEEEVKGKKTKKRSSLISANSSILRNIPYTVRVSTGEKSDHSTEANAFVVFIGTDAVSEKIHLELIDKTCFEPGSIETFSVEADANLGDIKKIEFGHDGYSPKDSWYVRNVEVDVPTMGHRYFFPCECWLGKDKEDGKTARIFSVDEFKDVTYKPKIPYQMTIYTGDVKNAGTDAEIKFTLFGDNGQSEEIKLEKGEDRFERNSVDDMHLDIDDVGNPTKIRIGHNGKGTRPHWFLEKVHLLNMSTEHITIFQCGHWLSKTEEDCKVARELSAEVAGKKLLEDIEYTIHVHTGDKRGCGTDANVFLIIFGETGNSGELALKESSTYKDKFERGHTDVFTFNMLSLGELMKIRIWHDNKYMRSGWFLSSVDIVDTKEDKTYNFPCGRWLAKDEDDGSLMRELVCVNNKMTSKENLALTGYEITLITSDKPKAGTNHNLLITLIDEAGKTSEEMSIQNSSTQKLLCRGTSDTVKVVSKPLGPIKSLIIRLQKRKGAKSEPDSLKWHLQDLIVKDIEADERYTFHCDDWLHLSSTKESWKELERSDVLKSKVSAIRELKPIKYKIKVHTANMSGAGTDANVCITLYGENGDSGKRELKKKFRDLFEKGNMDDFTIEVLDLGELSKLHIEHDNAGINAGWMLDRVEIENMDDNKTTVFPCQQWLDKKKGDKQICRDLYPQS